MFFTHPAADQRFDYRGPHQCHHNRKWQRANNHRGIDRTKAASKQQATNHQSKDRTPGDDVNTILGAFVSGTPAQGRKQVL